MEILMSSLSNELKWLRDVLACIDYVGTGDSRSAASERKETLDRFDRLVEAIHEAGALGAS